MKKVFATLRNILSRLGKRYHQEGIGFKTIAAAAASGVMFSFAANPPTIATVFGGSWPKYIPTGPFQIMGTVAGIALAYEAFHLYRIMKRVSRK